jgi:hypothetical protein
VAGVHGALPAELVDPPGPPPAGALITAADARETRLGDFPGWRQSRPDAGKVPAN